MYDYCLDDPLVDLVQHLVGDLLEVSGALERPYDDPMRSGAAHQ